MLALQIFNQSIEGPKTSTSNSLIMIGGNMNICKKNSGENTYKQSCAVHYQSINQSINQSISQSVNQSVSQSVSQSINRSLFDEDDT